MIYQYSAIFFNEEKGYSVFLPDWDYVGTCGDTLEEAIHMATDLLALLIVDTKEDGKIVPKPLDVSEIDLTEFFKSIDVTDESFFVYPILVDAEEYAETFFQEKALPRIPILNTLRLAAFDADLDLSELLENAIRKALAEKTEE